MKTNELIIALQKSMKLNGNVRVNVIFDGEIDERPEVNVEDGVVYIEASRTAVGSTRIPNGQSMDEDRAVADFKGEIGRLGLNYDGPGVDDVLTRFAAYLKENGLLADCFYGKRR